MKAKVLAVASLGLAVGMAGSAQADMLAGWDFSQYFGAGFLSTDGATFTDTLDANYSDLDPTFGAGAESGAFGTMFMDGSNGSTDVDEGSPGAEFVPTSLSLSSNIDRPGGVEFDSFTVLTDEGQTFANELSMTAADMVSVVFSADLTSVPEFGRAAVLSFGASTFSGTGSIDVEFSFDGSSYTTIGSLMIGASDALYQVNLNTGDQLFDLAYVRLTFGAPSGGGVGQVIIDNVAISAGLVNVPMLDTVGLVTLCGALMGFGASSLRRREEAAVASH